MAAETYRITEELRVEDKTGSGLSAAERKVSSFDKTIQKTQSQLSKLTGGRWSMTLNAVDKATKIISTVESKVSGIAKKAWNFTVGVIDKATAPLQSVFNLLKNPILQAGAILGISVGLADTINTFGGFEATMSKVQAISGASGEDMEALTALAKQMGATTKFTAEEAAQGLTYMAMAGWKTDDMMGSLAGVMNLAAASGEDLATVSDIVTDAMTAFGLAADGYTANGVSNANHFSDVLAAASSNANTNVSLMGETFKYVGSMAGALGYSIEDVALMTGLMANQGIKGTMAGTSLNSMLARLSTNTSGAADAIAELGVQFYNQDGSARSLGAVMGDLRTATKGMTQEQKANLANTVAGVEAQKGFLAILNASEEDYLALAEAIYNADGAAQQMSDTMLDNMQGSLTLLQSAVDGVKLSLGERLAPYVRSFADWLTSKMPAVDQIVGQVMDSVDTKIESLRGTISEFTSSEEWANADIWGKIKIAWDNIIAQPFSEWWDNTGKAWLEGKASSLGETLGSGITSGLLALLGFDASDAVDDGKSIGGSFLEGFKEGFDTEQITSALTSWASEHEGLVIAAGALLGGKLIGGAARSIQSILGLFGGGAGGVGTSVATMTVTAGVVNVNGGGTGTGTGTGKGTGTGGNGIVNGLAGVGRKLGSGATTAAGAAAAGSAAIAGGVMGGAGLVDAGIDIYHGTQQEGKEAQDSYYKGGAKTAMVAEGAAAGAAIGSVVPVIGTGVGALVGAGIGGIGALAGGDSAGQYMSDKATYGISVPHVLDFSDDVSARLTGISERYATALDGIMPEIEGTTAEKLGTAIQSALESGGNVSEWDAKTMASWLGIDSMSDELHNTIATLAEDMAKSIPQEIDTGMFADAAKAIVSDFGTSMGSVTAESLVSDIQAAISSGMDMNALSGDQIASLVGLNGNTNPALQGALKALAVSMATSLADQDYTASGDAVSTGVGAAIEGMDMGPIDQGINSVVTSTGASINSQFAPGFDTTTEVRVRANWRLTNPSATLTTSGGGTAYINASLNAEGGYYDHPELGWFGEDGPEYIIPVGAGRRERGMSLWRQAGEDLGVFGNDEDVTAGVSYPTTTSAGTGTAGDDEGTGGGIKVEVDFKPEIVIEAGQGADAEEIYRVMRDRVRDLVDDISDEMAEKLAKVFGNMPVRGGV